MKNLLNLQTLVFATFSMACVHAGGKSDQDQNHSTLIKRLNTQRDVTGVGENLTVQNTGKTSQSVQNFLNSIKKQNQEKTNERLSKYTVSAKLKDGTDVNVPLDQADALLNATDANDNIQHVIKNFNENGLLITIDEPLKNQETVNTAEQTTTDRNITVTATAQNNELAQNTSIKGKTKKRIEKQKEKEC